MAMDARDRAADQGRIPDAKVTIRDLAGDGDHYAATVISASFRGKSRVQQHQMVYEALKGQMGGVLHALALQTGTPEVIEGRTGVPRQRDGDRAARPSAFLQASRRWRPSPPAPGHRAGDFVIVAGMRGIDPNQQLVQGEEARIRQGFLNMKLIAESEGASLRDAVRLRRLRHRHDRLRPLVNKVQEELWGQGPYPPRTIVEVQRLNQDDIFEVEGTFYAPGKKAAVRCPWGGGLFGYIYRRDAIRAGEHEDLIHGIEQFIDNEVKGNDVVLFMKGTPQFPMCGFSGQVVQILDHIGVPTRA